MKAKHYIFVRLERGCPSHSGFETKETVTTLDAYSRFDAAAAETAALRQKSSGFLKISLLLSAMLVAFTACRTGPLAPVNLQEPGWVVREGQAVWKRNKEAPEIAGELLVATRDDGRRFVQFTKTPFPMIVAQSTTNRWQIEIPIQNKRFSAPGSPPKRLIWLYLPGLLSGQTPPKSWSWNELADKSWRVENARTGEMLEGYLSAPQK